MWCERRSACARHRQLLSLSLSLVALEIDLIALLHTLSAWLKSVADWFCSIQAHNEFAVNESISYMPTVQKISILQTTNCQLVHHIA